MGTDKDTAFFSECKWTKEKVDRGILEALVERNNLFSYKQKHFYLFAKIGFIEGGIDKADEMGNVALVAYHEMLF